MTQAAKRPYRPVDHLSLTDARHIALAAQGFGRRAPVVRAAAQLLWVTDRVAAVQIDSVNVLARSHYLPFYSRLGPYPVELLQRLTYGPRRRLFEYWGHEASLLPLHLYPLLRWRMQRAQRGEGIYAGLARFARERKEYVASVLAEIEREGPRSARELSEGGRGKGSWWGWSDGKRALEFLFWGGLVSTSARRGFERVYDLTERVLPAALVSAPALAEDEAQRSLVDVAGRALGVATERDLRDYFRLPLADARLRIDQLVEAGTLVPVAVEGWREAAFRHAQAHPGRGLHASALLSPFDSLVWCRDRALRLFDFHYRLELYTPAHKRVHGYYVLPFLHGARIAARVDLKADRSAGVLLVLAVHPESHAGPEMLPALAAELTRMASWLGLGKVRASRGVAKLARLMRRPD